MWDLCRCPARSLRRRLPAASFQALLTPFAVTTPGVFLYHSGKRQVLPKLRAFIAHVKTRAPRLRATGRLRGGSARATARKVVM